MTKRRGFTLVELLVVIAIIALLMAILMPALARVRKQAKAVICMQNLNQWGTVFSMYTGDHDGYFHSGWNDLHPLGNAYSAAHDEWSPIMEPYYQNPELRLCPMATRTWWLLNPGGGSNLPGPGRFADPFSAWGVSDGSWLRRGDYGSYGINGWVCNPPAYVRAISSGGYPTKFFWRSVNVKGAGNIPLFADALWCVGWPRHGNSVPPYNGNLVFDSGDEMERFCFNRHNGGTNMLFMDFSVRKARLKCFWNFKWSRQFDLSEVEKPTLEEWRRELWTQGLPGCD